MSAFAKAFRSRRVAVMLPLGLVAALPNALSQSTLTTWMATLKVDLKTIGYFALVGLPYNLKFLWAPLLDRYPLPFLGRRRGWMIVFLGAALAFVYVLAGQDPATRPGLVAALAVAIGFVGASFDVVLDAYRTDVLLAAERGSGASMYVAGYRVALLITGSVALILAATLSWRIVYLGLGTLLVVGIATTLWAPEPAESIQPPRTLRDAVVEPLTEFFRRPKSLVVVAFVMIYTFGDTTMTQMLSTFLYREVKFTLAEIGTIHKLANFGGTVAGAMLGGALVAKWGVRRCLWAFGGAAAASNLLYVALAQAGKSYALLVLAVGGDNFCGGLRTAAFTAFLMSLCDKRYSAFQYALLSSAMSIVGRTVAAQSGAIVESVGWTGFFAITSAMAVPALALLWAVPPPPPEPESPAEAVA